MKKLIAIAAIVATAGGAFAVNLDLGTQEILLRGGVDFDSATDTQFDLGVGYGYFVMDYLEVLGTFDFYDDDLQTRWGLGVGVEYDFDTGTAAIPYIGGRVSLEGVDLNGPGNQSNTAAVGQISGGSKFFVTEDLAIDLGLFFSFASDDIYAESTGGNPATITAESTDWQVRWGLRYFWD